MSAKKQTPTAAVHSIYTVGVYDNGVGMELGCSSRFKNKTYQVLRRKEQGQQME